MASAQSNMVMESDLVDVYFGKKALMVRGTQIPMALASNLSTVQESIQKCNLSSSDADRVFTVMALLSREDVITSLERLRGNGFLKRLASGKKVKACIEHAQRAFEGQLTDFGNVSWDEIALGLISDLKIGDAQYRAKVAKVGLNAIGAEIVPVCGQMNRPGTSKVWFHEPNSVNDQLRAMVRMLDSFAVDVFKTNNTTLMDPNTLYTINRIIDDAGILRGHLTQTLTPAEMEDLLVCSRKQFGAHFSKLTHLTLDPNLRSKFLSYF